MKKLTFNGGIHPIESKDTKNLKIENIEYPNLFYIPLNQHIGKIAKPVVKTGDYVLKGQLLAEKDGLISANIHSPVSGTVKEIKNIVIHTGNKVPALIIENDEKFNEVEYENIKDPFTKDKDILIKKIENAGIVGLGGATFPTSVKLSPKHKIDSLIINACECEPYLTVDYRLILEKTDELITGIQILLHILGIKNAYIGIEDNKIDAYLILKEKVKKIKNKNVNVILLKTKYPQGGEKQLIKAILDREVPPEGLPFEIGVIVQNVQTIIAIKEAIIEGKPLTEKVITLSGFFRKPGNIRVPIGMLIKDLIEIRGGIPEIVKKIVLGGPMMGISISEANIPITKGTSGVLLLGDKPKEEYECIRCSKCVDVCPMNLLPTEIYRKIVSKGYIELKNLNPVDCIECGSCAYVCPSNIPLVQYLKLAKNFVK